jgi:hypothetical protein
LRQQKGHKNAEGCEATTEAGASITAISTKQESDEHLILLHRRLRRESGHLTKQKEPRPERPWFFYSVLFFVIIR